MNKRGLASGLLALMLVGFLFGLFSLFSIYMWESFNTGIQNLPNQTVSQDVKDQVAEIDLVYMSDKLFVILFVVLLVAYLISAATIPVEEPIYFLLFLAMLIIFTLLSMVLSNAWVYITTQPDLISAAANLTFTDFFLRFFPFVVFITGISGSLIFYGRKYIGTPGFSGGGSSDKFE